MCGIFGFYLRRPLTAKDVESGKLATDKLSHRGPDNTGYWNNTKQGVFLGHTRLSIQDTSKSNNQPYKRDNIKLVFNGEIYNFLELRNNLINQGYSFRTTGDTEVLANAWLRYGEDALNLFDGMYAFALFHNKELFLTVDIFGEKPLYWCENNDGVYFSSEPAPLIDLLNLEVDLSEDRKNEFLALGYIPSPYTAFKGLQRCEPATIIKISPLGKVSQRRYWKKPEQYISNGRLHPISKLELDTIEEKLTSSLSRRLIADVPKGLFLSSGVDSSLIASIMCKNLDEDVQALTVAYNSNDIHDESMSAKKIADYLNIEHILVNSEELNSEYNLNELDTIFNEPNIGLTAFSVRQMSRLSKKYFTVALAGTGGDEVFFGYGKHYFFYKYRHILTNQLLKSFFRKMEFFTKYSKRAKTYNYLSSFNNNELLFALKNSPYYADIKWTKKLSKVSNSYFNDVSAIDLVLKTRNFDMDINLPNMVIPAIERASMREGLEVRTPFLNRELLEVVSNIDYRKFVAFGQKNVLRLLLERFLPKNLFDFPKKGFIFPTDVLLQNSTQYIQSGVQTNMDIKYINHKMKVDDKWNSLLLRHLILEYYR
jgi:asparagine synthase (glutamine-hydrolysing)